MDLGLKGRTALVCGSSRGLGRAIADALAGEGVDLVLNSRSAEDLDVARREIAEATGVRVAAVAADLADPPEVDRLVEEARGFLGRIDILVTNAGGPPSGPFEDHSAEVWRQAIAQNFESVVNLVRAALPGMKERRWGRIVNVTSISVKQPVAGLILSNSLRAGVTGFAKTISNEVGPYNVTVNCVLPGYTRTERLVNLAGVVAERDGTTIEGAYEGWASEVPMGRIGEPEDVVSAIEWLLEPGNTWVSGQVIGVDGGLATLRGRART